MRWHGGGVQTPLDAAPFRAHVTAPPKPPGFGDTHRHV